MIKISLKHALSITLLSLFICVNPVNANADTGETLQKLYQMRTTSIAILGDFYMFSGLEGDSRYSREIDNGIKQFEIDLASLTTDGHPQSDVAKTTKIINDWTAFKTLLQTNRSEFLRDGFSNARLVDELGKNATTLSESLGDAYTSLVAETKFPISKWTQYTRDMGLIIQTVTAEYAARSTSSLGQVMVLKINEGGMDEQAKIFAGLLEELKKAPQNDKAILKVMDQVGVKWEFIAKSVANYNENAVPFIINSYGDRITKNLEEIGNHYNGSLQATK